MDILIIYQFCSFGGVERALLNRAEAFQSHGMNVVISVGYLEDYGALEAFRRYIKVNHLERKLIPFLIPNDFDFTQTRHDLILIIDTPQIFDKIRLNQNVFVECHTPYIENRQYLKELPENIKGIIVPSASFRLLIMSEFPGLQDIFVLTHPIPNDFFAYQSAPHIFGKRPLTYLARIDSLKNYEEAVLLFESVMDRKDIFQIVIGRGGSLTERISSLEQKNLLASTLIREKVLFDKVPALIDLVREHRGVFISPSRGESFGLSAAEFICGGVPVLLSDIPEHKELVNHDERFLYPLGDIKSGKDKLIQILNDWDSLSAKIKTYGIKFKSDSFIDNWHQFIKKYGYSIQ